MKHYTSIKYLLSSLCILSGNTYAQVNNPKPNIVLILADDLGYGDLGITGSKQIKTPNIDALAASGVFCNTGYVTSAVSSPSRAGLMTGRNQVEFGHDNNIGGNQTGFDKSFLGLPVKEQTLANRLKNSGYVTGLIGKWHLGEEDHFHPVNRGFDEFWGYLGGGHNYFPTKKGNGYNTDIICNFGASTKVSYITDDKGDQCASFIDRHKEEPFFLFASFNAPHAPLQAKESDLAKYKHIKDKRRRTYCAMVDCLDANVAKIVQSLKDNGVYENTIIFFLSDNGGPTYMTACNAPLNGQKGCLLEGGIRVPYIVSYPKMLPANTQYQNAVSSLDIAATSCALAGADTTGLEGVNLVPFLAGKTDQQPHELLKWRFTISAAIRYGNYKLIRVPDRFPLLFDLSTDIGEKKNLVFEKPQLAEKLLKQLGQWDISLPHPVFLEGAQYKKSQLLNYDTEFQTTQPED